VSWQRSLRWASRLSRKSDLGRPSRATCACVRARVDVCTGVVISHGRATERHPNRSPVAYVIVVVLVAKATPDGVRARVSYLSTIDYFERSHDVAKQFIKTNDVGRNGERDGWME